MPFPNPLSGPLSGPRSGRAPARARAPVSGRLTRRAFLRRVGLALCLASAPALALSAPQGAMLVCYYSRTGNTRAVAQAIHRRVGGDLLELTTARPYPAEYEALTRLAKDEQRTGARPALGVDVPDMGRYGTIFLGFPNWWGTMPMLFFTLLEACDTSGKQIIPFCTHGGSALGNAPRDLKRLCPRATVHEGLAVRGTAAATAQATVDAWLGRLGLYAP